jgi:hypothetical protein
MSNYYENIESYHTKKSELQEARVKFNIHQDAQIFQLENFQQELESIASDVKILPKGEEKKNYLIEIKIDKNKIKKFNKFIETLSLRYLVKIEGNQLNFKEKEQYIQINFTLKKL